jgi:hypothetical protein
MPSSVSFNEVAYKFPSEPLSANTFLRTDSAGNLSWTSINTFLSSASARVTVNKGLTATVNDVPSTTFSLITSSNVTIGGVFLPTAHVTFNQSGTITRNANVASVTPTDLATVTGSITQIYGQTLESGVTPFDVPGISGGYIIDLNNTVTSTATAVVDIKIQNGSYYYTRNGEFGDRSQILNSYFVWLSPYNRLLVAFYVPAANMVGNIRPPLLTAGYNDQNTRFSVTVYD